MSYANFGVFASVFPGLVEAFDFIFSGSIYKYTRQKGFRFVYFYPLLLDDFL